MPSVNASELRIEGDGQGFAAYSDFALERYVSFGREVGKLSFTMSIVGPPPCDRLVLYYDLQTPEGAYLARRSLQDAGLRDVREGATYVAWITHAEIGRRAGNIRFWPECSMIR